MRLKGFGKALVALGMVLVMSMISSESIKIEAAPLVEGDDIANVSFTVGEAVYNKDVELAEGETRDITIPITLKYDVVEKEGVNWIDVVINVEQDDEPMNYFNVASISSERLPESKPLPGDWNSKWINPTVAGIRIEDPDADNSIDPVTKPKDYQDARNVIEAGSYTHVLNLTVQNTGECKYVISFNMTYEVPAHSTTKKSDVQLFVNVSDCATSHGNAMDFDITNNTGIAYDFNAFSVRYYCLVPSDKNLNEVIKFYDDMLSEETMKNHNDDSRATICSSCGGGLNQGWFSGNSSPVGFYPLEKPYYKDNDPSKGIEANSYFEIDIITGGGNLREGTSRLCLAFPKALKIADIPFTLDKYALLYNGDIIGNGVQYIDTSKPEEFTTPPITVFDGGDESEDGTVTIDITSPSTPPSGNVPEQIDGNALPRGTIMADISFDVVGDCFKLQLDVGSVEFSMVYILDSLTANGFDLLSDPDTYDINYDGNGPNVSYYVTARNPDGDPIKLPEGSYTLSLLTNVGSTFKEDAESTPVPISPDHDGSIDVLVKYYDSKDVEKSTASGSKNIKIATPRSVN